MPLPLTAWLAGCAGALPTESGCAACAAEVEAGQAEGWTALVAESVLHLGFDTLEGADGVVDDSPSGLAGGDTAAAGVAG